MKTDKYVDIFEEINSILISSNHPSKDIEKIMKKEEFILSEFNILNKLKDIPQEKKFHPEGNVWNHSKLVVDLAAKIKEIADNKKYFMWAALFHDIGKIETTEFVDGRYRSYNHDKVGKKVIYDILLKYMNDYEAKAIADIVGFHMHHIYVLNDLPFSNINALVNSKYYNDIIMMFTCDKLGRGNQNSIEWEKSFKDIYKIIDILDKEKAEINKEVLRKLNIVKNLLLN
ncbi:MAG: HDIG domain-containing protein [Clostridium sp.]|nr:HDIG domain-containing protein [Clostridium sp.]